MGKRYAKPMQSGQAMVEFALTSLLFILVVVSIIELARIMHAYVTIQHAARVGARYAVTGQWMPEFAGPNGAAHYNPDSGEPYDRIYPCWPRFHDDPQPKAQTPRGTDYYEPFRGPRTCSIEKQVLQQMRPLALVPDAGFYQSGHYQVVVSSPAADSTPTSGGFTRFKLDGTPDQRNYIEFYDNLLPTAELVRGYAGRPNAQVVVQIRYNIRLVTPLLSNIVPYIPLQARVVMTNEAFGSTSVLTEAAPAPNMGPVGPLHLPIPADLTFVTEKTKNKDVGNTNPGLSDPLTYEVTITNSGELNVITSFQLCLYASQEELTDEDLSDPTTLDSMSKQCTSVPELESGMDHKAEITFSSWESMGTRYIYAVVDPATHTDEDDEVEGSIDEEGTDPSYPEQEENNWLFIEEIEVGKGVDINLLVTVLPTDSSDTPKYSATETFDITVTVSNLDSDHEINRLSVYLPLPTDLTVIPGGGYTAPYWSDVTVPARGSVQLTVRVQVNASISGSYDVILRAEINEGHLPEGYYQDDENQPIWDDIWHEQIVKLQNQPSE